MYCGSTIWKGARNRTGHSISPSVDPYHRGTQDLPMRYQKKKKTTLYTLVQHSAFALEGDLSFEHAVECRVLSTKSEAIKVQNASGVIESDWRKINAREISENYRAGRKSSLERPHANGTFASARIEGQRVYVPQPRNADTATASSYREDKEAGKA
jgi:hypothetical protein